MIDIEKSHWVENRLRLGVKCSGRGNQLTFRCFICGDSQKNRSKKRGHFYRSTCSTYCFNCQESLHGLNIIAKLENRSYRDVNHEYLCEKYGKKKKPIKIIEFAPDVVEKIDLNMFDRTLPEPVTEYLTTRKILTAPFLPNDYVFRFDTETKRLIIPWYTNGVATYFQGRALQKTVSPKYLFPKVSKTVFNIDVVDPTIPYIFLLEGVFDAVFVRNGVAIGGKNLTNDQRTLLEARWPNHQLVYFFDNHYMEPELIDHILKLADTQPEMKFILWPKKIDRIKDINQFIMLGGKNVFENNKWLENNTLSPLRVKFLLKGQ